MRELREIGCEFTPEYIERLKQNEALRLQQRAIEKQKKLESKEPYTDSDDRFFFIAGYTFGGAPYGVTWEKMGLSPYENIFED